MSYRDSSSINIKHFTAIYVFSTISFLTTLIMNFIQTKYINLGGLIYLFLYAFKMFYLI